MEYNLKTGREGMCGMKKPEGVRTTARGRGGGGGLLAEQNIQNEISSEGGKSQRKLCISFTECAHHSLHQKNIELKSNQAEINSDQISTSETI
jgi:hypothetical protein